MDLARLWLAKEPDNPRIRLLLAGALFELGENDRAYRQFELLLRPGAGDLGVYQAASDIVARHYRGGDPLGFFQRLVDLRPDDPDGWFSKALLANRLKDSPAVLAAVDQALALRPDWEEAALIKLAILADTGQDVALRQFAERFTRSHPRAVHFQLQYARVLFENRDYAGALRQFRAILRHDPENEDAAYAAGLISLDAGEYRRAREYLLLHLKLLPDHDQTRIYLAEAEIGLGNHAAAKRWLNEVSDPELTFRARLKLAEVIAETDGLEAALAHLRGLTAMDADELAQLYSAQDRLLQDAGRLQEAMKVLDEALEQLPGDPDLLYSRGLLAARLKLVSRAEKDLRKLIELEPDNAHAYNALGYTLADITDRYQEAKELVEKALELSPDDPFILDSMGWIWYRLGDYAKALEFLRRAWRIRDDPEIAAHLGEVLWVSGQRKEAEKVLSSALEKFPDNILLKSAMERLEREEGLNDNGR